MRREKTMTLPVLFPPFPFAISVSISFSPPSFTLKANPIGTFIRSRSLTASADATSELAYMRVRLVIPNTPSFFSRKAGMGMMLRSGCTYGDGGEKRRRRRRDKGEKKKEKEKKGEGEGGGREGGGGEAEKRKGWRSRARRKTLPLFLSSLLPPPPPPSLSI